MKMHRVLRILIVLAAAAILPACRHLPHHRHVSGDRGGLEAPPTAPAEAPRSNLAE